MSWVWRIAWSLVVEPAEPVREPTPVVELRWAAPVECPDAEQVRAKVVELVGRPLAEDPRRVLRVEGTITHGDGYELVLRIDAGEGANERRLAAPRCEELLEPAAVVVAVAVDPLIEPPEVVPEAPAIAEPPQPVAPTPHAAAPIDAEPAEPRPRPRAQQHRPPFA